MIDPNACALCHHPREDHREYGEKTCVALKRNNTRKHGRHGAEEEVCGCPAFVPKV